MIGLPMGSVDLLQVSLRVLSAAIDQRAPDPGDVGLLKRAHPEVANCERLDDIASRVIHAEIRKRKWRWVVTA